MNGARHLHELRESETDDEPYDPNGEPDVYDSPDRWSPPPSSEPADR